MKDQHIGFQVVGYPDERGAGTPVIIAGAELGRKKVMAAWVAIKPGHKFPKGIKLAVLEERREADKAIFISETIADEQQAADELRIQRDKEAAQAKIDAAKKKSQIAAADKAMRDTATARDAANFEVNSAKLDRDNAKSNALAAEADDKSFTDQSKKMFQKKLTDADARLERANKAFAAADKAWLDAKDAREKFELKNDGKPDPKFGPTVEEFVEAGYDPKNYPPTGFDSKSTPEAIAKAIKAFDEDKEESE